MAEAMSADAALTRVGYALARYAGCDSTVVRVLSAMDMEAVQVLADIARGELAAAIRAAAAQATEARDR